jgi:hypothetical protein
MVRKAINLLLRIRYTVMHCITVILIITFVEGCTDVFRRLDPVKPKVVEPKDIHSVIRTLPSNTRFGYSGLKYFNGKLYASSNIGLLEFCDRKPHALYYWFTYDNVVEGPWLDMPNASLWLWRLHSNDLIRLNGNGWYRTNLPVPPRGHYSRGDILSGFVGISNNQNFWLIGGGHVWRWHDKTKSWKLEPIPPAGKWSGTMGVAPLSKGLLYIVREEVGVLPLAKYSAYLYTAGQWERIPLGTFGFRQVLTIENTAFIHTREGDLLTVTDQTVNKVIIPGTCEAIATTSTGRLLGVFRDKGIYVYNKKWIKLFDYPYSNIEGEHRAYLAEYDAEVAYATTSELESISQGKRTYSGTVALWISSGNTLRRADLEYTK